MEQALSEYLVGERRQEGRLPQHVNLIYSKLNNRGGLLCMANSETMDVSRSGCCLKIYHKLKLDDFLEMQLWLGAKAVWEIYGQLVWLKQENGTWLAGIKFLSTIDVLN